MIIPSAVACVLFFAGCSTSVYLVKLGWGQAKVVVRSRSNERILNDATVDASTKEKIQLVMEAKAYAEKHSSGCSGSDSEDEVFAWNLKPHRVSTFFLPSPSHAIRSTSLEVLLINRILITPERIYELARERVKTESPAIPMAPLS